MAKRPATAGVREFKAHLSAYLRRVRAGETVLITDRGQLVAEVHRPTPLPRRGGRPKEIEARRRQAIEEGWLRAARMPSGELTRRVNVWEAIELPRELREKLSEWRSWERGRD